ncbi:MAG: acylase [Acidimicrobiia bacterium]|nr:acylase [Acidimicrobiia bacterium]
MSRLKRWLLGFAGTLLLFTAWLFWPESAGSEVEGIAPTPGTYDALIRRDTYGIPHVWGDTDADAAYGLAFAHAEDDFLTIQQTVLAARGKLASVYGPDSAPIDYFVHLLRIPEAVEAGWPELSPATRALCDAYAAGLNHYAELHPDDALVGLFPVEGRDVVRGFTQKVPLFFGLESTIGALFEEERPDLTAAVAPAVRYGSNVFAVSPNRTEASETMLVSNSHQPWTGPVAWYEAHVTSDEGWDMTGALFPGMPVLALGHNRDLAWSFTVNHPDLIDVYELDIDPDDENRYRVDGEWLTLEVGEAPIEVRLAGRLRWTFSQEVLWSIYGPVVRQDHGTYAIRYAGIGETGLVEQLFEMNKAATFDEWREALNRQDGLPSFSVGYADRTGKIAYLYHGLFPDRDPAFDWEGYAPGDTRATLWDGYLPLDDLPWVIDPSGGFIQNSNSTPFNAALEPLDPSSFPASMGVEDQETNRSLRSRELFGAANSITLEDLKAIKWDMTFHQDSLPALLVNRIIGDDWPADLEEAVDLLRSWDREADPDDRVTGLVITLLSELLEADIDLDPSQMGEELEVGDGVLETALRNAVVVLEENHGTIAPRWSDMNRLVRGDLDIGLGGAPDLLHAVYGDPVDGRFEGIAGDAYVQFVVFHGDGSVTSEAVHQFGSATMDETSVHYSDQAVLFAGRGLRPVWYDEADILANLEREYRPGE